MANSFPKVAVLLLNYNQWAMTTECVESVLKLSYPNFTVFVFDNGSESAEDFNRLKKLVSARCRVIRIEPNRGYVGGMNIAMETASQAGFELFLVMNNDAVIDSDALTHLVSTARQYSYRCIVTGKVYHYDRPDTLQFIGYRITNRKRLSMERLVHDEVDRGQWDRIMELDMTDDIFWLIPDTIYRQTGGYSPYFWFNAEQADLALRAVKAGNKLIFTPNAKLWHKGSITIGGRNNNPRLIYYNIQASLIFKYIHTGRLHFISYYFSLIGSFVKSVIKAIRDKMQGNKHPFQTPYAYYKAIGYFHRWLIVRQHNTGKTPFDK